MPKLMWIIEFFGSIEAFFCWIFTGINTSNLMFYMINNININQTWYVTQFIDNYLLNELYDWLNGVLTRTRCVQTKKKTPELKNLTNKNYSKYFIFKGNFISKLHKKAEKLIMSRKFKKYYILHLVILFL